MYSTLLKRFKSTKKLISNYKSGTLYFLSYIQVGQEAYKSVVRSFYKGVSAILLVYSIDKQETYDQLNIWMK